MDKVYLLTKQQDYESEEVVGVYKEVPPVPHLTGLLKDSFGYCLEDSEIERLAEELHIKGSVYIMWLHTWEMEVWGLQ